jgi:hypothetical protein
MTIEIKYKPSDDIWFMHQNKPKTGFIDKILIKLERGEKSTRQYQVFGIDNLLFNENELFYSKEDLLKSFL